LTPECRVYKRLERKKRSATQLRKEKKKENKGGSNSYRGEEANYKKSNQSWIKVLKTSFNLRD